MALSAACTSQSSPAPVRSPAAGRAVTAQPAALRRFYTQQLSWHSCDGSFQCTSLLVPLDYAHPRGRTLHIAVIRQPASGRSEGSLIINPGGPGARV